MKTESILVGDIIDVDLFQLPVSDRPVIAEIAGYIRINFSEGNIYFSFSKSSADPGAGSDTLSTKNAVDLYCILRQPTTYSIDTQDVWFSHPLLVRDRLGLRPLLRFSARRDSGQIQSTPRCSDRLLCIQPYGLPRLFHAIHFRRSSFGKRQRRIGRYPEPSLTIPPQPHHSRSWER